MLGFVGAPVLCCRRAYVRVSAWGLFGACSISVWVVNIPPTPVQAAVDWTLHWPYYGIDAMLVYAL